MALIIASDSWRGGRRIKESREGITRGLVFDWTPMTGPTWDYAVDNTGIHTTTTLGNMVPATDWSRRPAALSFGSGWQLKSADAGDDYIDFGVNPFTSQMQQISVGWWGTFVSQAPTGAQLIVGKGSDPSHAFGFRLRTVSGGGGWGFEVSYASVDLRCHFDSSAKERITSGVPNFIMATWNGGTTASTDVIGYKNGAGPLAHFLNANGGGARTNDSGAPLRILNHDDFPAVGSPDMYTSRIAIWNRVVTAPEVRLLARFPLWGTPGFASSASAFPGFTVDAGKGGIGSGPGIPILGGAGEGGGGGGSGGDGWMGMSQMFKTGSL